MLLTQTKSIVAKILANENISVYQTNTRTAYFNVKSRTLVLPFWKNELDGIDFTENVVTMFIGHEVSHALYTPAEGIHNCNHDAELKKIPFDIINVVEDARIEKMIKVKYPGLVSVFRKGYKELWEGKFKPDFSDISSSNFINRLNFYFKFFDSQSEIKLEDIVKNEKEEELFLKVRNIETWEETLTISREIKEYIDLLRQQNKEELKKQVQEKKKEKEQKPQSSQQDDDEDESGETEQGSDYSASDEFAQEPEEEDDTTSVNDESEDEPEKESVSEDPEEKDESPEDDNSEEDESGTSGQEGEESPEDDDTDGSESSTESDDSDSEKEDFEEEMDAENNYNKNLFSEMENFTEKLNDFSSADSFSQKIIVNSPAYSLGKGKKYRNIKSL